MICSDLHTALASLLAQYNRNQVAVLLDSNVPFDSSFPTLCIESDEAHKSIETVCRIWDFLLEQKITRRGVLVCIGGGVLTDIGGFAAATYKRGIDSIHIPTTLLAMTDASSGGKTGFNHGGLKNVIGCFALPVETLIWPGWLKTLPVRQVLSGFGEMLKTGLIEANTGDRAQGTDRLWNRLLQYDLEVMDIDQLTPLIAECVAVKERIVTADPKEEGLRKTLNFGHTFGHALEEMSILSSTGPDLHPIPHGYAVVYGMIAELYLSVTHLGCPKEPLQQLTQLMLRYYGRPDCKCSDRTRLAVLMQQDKKNEHVSEINCTLLQSVGEPVINQVVTQEEANEALEYLFSL
jgi:3-dehydroquinate synthase